MKPQPLYHSLFDMITVCSEIGFSIHRTESINYLDHYDPEQSDASHLVDALFEMLCQVHDEIPLDGQGMQRFRSYPSLRNLFFRSDLNEEYRPEEELCTATVQAIAHAALTEESDKARPLSHDERMCIERFMSEHEKQSWQAFEASVWDRSAENLYQQEEARLQGVALARQQDDNVQEQPSPAAQPGHEPANTVVDIGNPYADPLMDGEDSYSPPGEIDLHPEVQIHEQALPATEHGVNRPGLLERLTDLTSQLCKPVLAEPVPLKNEEVPHTLIVEEHEMDVSQVDTGWERPDPSFDQSNWSLDVGTAASVPSMDMGPADTDAGSHAAPQDKWFGDLDMRVDNREKGYYGRLRILGCIEMDRKIFVRERSGIKPSEARINAWLKIFTRVDWLTREGTAVAYY